MQKMTTCLWFDHQAEEAANFYVSVFKDGKIGNTMHYNADSAQVSGRPEGSVLTVEFKILGHDFVALNGGPIFKFTEAVSFMVNCETQEEVDYYWEKLSAVATSEQCGWLKDKYGVSWQIVPKILNELLQDKDAKKSGSVMRAMLEMKKLDIAGLQNAYDQA